MSEMEITEEVKAAEESREVEEQVSEEDSTISVADYVPTPFANQNWNGTMPNGNKRKEFILRCGKDATVSRRRVKSLIGH